MKRTNKMTKHYKKTLCECIAGQEIVGMGKPSDKHLTCHRCNSSLFPWERQEPVCGACVIGNTWDKAHPVQTLHDKPRPFIIPVINKFLRKWFK